MSFDTPEGRYELRLQRPSAAGISADTRPPYVGLFRCDVVCSEVARLAGAIGASGIEVLAFVPSTAGPFSVAGQSITGLRAFTAIGEAAAGGLHTVDEMALPDTAVPPIVQVEFGIAPASYAGPAKRLGGMLHDVVLSIVAGWIREWLYQNGDASVVDGAGHRGRSCP